MIVAPIYEFQSPSLRGSGRFASADVAEERVSVVFQSPSLRGSGRFRNRADAERLRGEVSIPFIAGQWSLRVHAAHGRTRRGVVSIPFIAGQWSLRGGYPTN